MHVWIMVVVALRGVPTHLKGRGMNDTLAFFLIGAFIAIYLLPALIASVRRSQSRLFACWYFRQAAS
jgi:hypothetical protein